MKGGAKVPIPWLVVAALAALALTVLVAHPRMRREGAGGLIKALAKLVDDVASGNQITDNVVRDAEEFLGTLQKAALRSDALVQAAKSSKIALIKDMNPDQLKKLAEAVEQGLAVSADNLAREVRAVIGSTKLSYAQKLEAVEKLAKKAAEEGNLALVLGNLVSASKSFSADELKFIKQLHDDTVKAAGNSTGIAGPPSKILQKLKENWVAIATGAFGTGVAAVFLAAQIKAWVDEGGGSGDGGGDDKGGNPFGDSSTLLLWGGGAAVCCLFICMCLGLGAFLVMQGGNNNNNASSNNMFKI